MAAAGAQILSYLQVAVGDPLTSYPLCSGGAGKSLMRLVFFKMPMTYADILESLGPAILHS